MGADEQAKDSLHESTDPKDAERTERVAAISFADAKIALGEDGEKSELDEQPTKKMSALSAARAEEVLPSSGRSVRVFKNPSKPPPPRLELPLATAQHQAIVDEPSVVPVSQSRRGQIVGLALALSFGVGGAAAWMTNGPDELRSDEVSSQALTPTGEHVATSRPPLDSPPEAAAPSEETPAPPAAAAPSGVTDSPAAENGTGQPRPVRRLVPRVSEPSGEERAEALLEEADTLRGNELRVALEEAASADPTNPHAAAALAEFHMENDPHEALEWALTASQLRRRRARYQDLIADAYERIGNLNDAAHARATAVTLREGGD